MPLFGKAKDQAANNKIENDVRLVSAMSVEDKYELKDLLGT